MNTANGHKGWNKYWVIGIGLAIILFLFILALFLKRYENDNLWNITLAVFSLLGILLTVGAAVPAISAILSYQNFTVNAQRAEKDLENLKREQDEVKKKIENALPDLSNKIQQLDKMIERQNIRKIIYHYIRNERLTESEEMLKDYWVELLSLNKSDCTLYELIAVKKWEVIKYQGELANKEIEYGNISKMDKEELKKLNDELEELYRIVSYFDSNVKKRYSKNNSI